MPVEALRDYRLASVFGYTPDEIDSASAIRLDWLLGVHSIVRQIENEKDG